VRLQASTTAPERAICARVECREAGDWVITSEDLDRLMRAVEDEAETFLTGRGVGTGFTQAEDMTIFGPFGGPAPDLPGSELVAGQNAVSKQFFESGQSTLDVVNRIVADDLVVLVMIERNSVRLRGTAESQPWVLRSTQVFQLDEGGQWWRLHRHADPLIRFRPGDETFALAREASA
jgi:hypothetical protein